MAVVSHFLLCARSDAVTNSALPSSCALSSTAGTHTSCQPPAEGHVHSSCAQEEAKRTKGNLLGQTATWAQHSCSARSPNPHQLNAADPRISRKEQHQPPAVTFAGDGSNIGGPPERAYRAWATASRGLLKV